MHESWGATRNRQWMIVSLVMLAVGHPLCRAESPAKVNGVRILLKWEDRDPDESKDPRTRLLRMGADAFPAYEDILNDPKATPVEVSRILDLVRLVKADRSRFLAHALRRLADSDKEVRCDAVQLLAEIGTSADASPVVALLSDGDRMVVHSSATTLVIFAEIMAVEKAEISSATPFLNRFPALRHRRKRAR